jgi:starch-binding outer membrane protein, SusD/RagB family
MKNIKIYLFVALSGLFFNSCDDAIDIVQQGELYPDTAFESVNDLQLGLNGVYTYLGGETEILFTSIFTDEIALGIANGGQGRDGDLGFIMNTNNGYAGSIWRGNYATIVNANRLIAGAAGVTPTEDETAEYNNILAQAYAIRAYQHLILMSYFCTDMTDDSALGVIALDHVAGINEYLPRNTAGEVFALIESDLDFAEANITETTISQRYYIGQNFIKAVRARMAAYRGQYTVAEQYADELIALYPLTPKGSGTNQHYKNIWSDTDPVTATNSEVIFKLQRTNATANFSQFWSSLNSTVTGSAFYEVNRSLFNLVNNTSDVRRLIIADPTSIIDPSYSTSSDYLNSDVLPVGKYPGSEGTFLMNDVKVFRVSEMYFIKAEARVAAGDLAGAASAIAAVRSARYGSTQTVSYADATSAWAGILNERRAELAFEGHRYIDLKRLGTLANKGVERDPMDCSWNGACSLSADDYRFTLPIPFSELTVNTNIQQNPGY